MKQRIGFVVLILMVTVLGIVVINQYQVLKDLQGTVQQNKKQVQKLSAQVESKTKEVEKLNNRIKHIQDTACGGEQFSYEDYNCITDASTPNYEYSVCKAHTDENGLRKIGNSYCVALASDFGTKIGTKYKVTLSTGKVINVILTDQKADCDTNGYKALDGSVIEFIVDTDCLPLKVSNLGSISYLKGFGGKLESIKKVS
jgi:hypothetical protein